MRKAIAGVLVLLVVGLPADGETAPRAREGADHAVPLYGELVRAWDAPHDDPFAAGHRGIDVHAAVGSTVSASAPGLVSFAGSVAGNRSVTIDHGGDLRTSYSFLGSVTVKRGDEVEQGDVVGRVGRGHTTGELPSHVHLSARESGVYFDPIELYLGSSYADLLALTA